MHIKFTLVSFVIGMLVTSASLAATEVIKIGHAAPLSGPNARLGKENENAAKIAIAELNANPTLINGKKVKFVLISADDGSDLNQAKIAAQKLVDAKVNGVIGHLNSSISIAVAKIYHAAGIPQISPSSTATAYTAMGYDSTFRVVAGDDQLGRILGRYAVQTLKAKTIAVIDDKTAYGQGIATEFMQGAKTQAKIKTSQINFSHSYLSNNKLAEIKALLRKIKSEKPDVIFFGGMDTLAGPLLNQMKMADIKAKFMGGDGICSADLAKLAGGLSDIQVTCAEAGGVVDTQQIAYDNFLTTYKKKFGIDAILYAPYVYDSVMTLANAMQTAKSSDPAIYLPFLRNSNYHGITGDIAFDAKGNIKDGILTLYTFKSDKRQQIGILR